MKWTLILLCFFTFSSLKGQQIVEDIGHGVMLGLPLSALTMNLIKKDKQGAIQLFKSLAVESVVVISMKRIINRKRPNGGNYSFPSGHTASSFMASTFIWKRYGWKWGVPATALASFVGYSRAGTDEPVHYWSDVFVGAGIGILSSYFLTTKFQDSASLKVVGDTSFVGLSLRYNLN